MVDKKALEDLKRRIEILERDAKSESKRLDEAFRRQTSYLKTH